MRGYIGENEWKEATLLVFLGVFILFRLWNLKAVSINKLSLFSDV
jgi:hypothetical protein